MPSVSLVPGLQPAGHRGGRRPQVSVSYREVLVKKADVMMMS